ncbi:MAG: hypothetical protein JO159_14890, partial [Acidobacteria bacterium]|nr:hypothetical protein [Acidobacteriota bacterium]
FGWLAFGGNLSQEGSRIRVTPLDSARTRVYLSPLGLWLTLDAGSFRSVEFDWRTRRVRITLSEPTDYTPVARLHVEQPAKRSGIGNYHPAGTLSLEREAYVIPLSQAGTEIELASP